LVQEVGQSTQHPEGALARITPEVTAAAIALVRTGDVIDLGSLLSAEMPFASKSPIFFPFRIVRNRSGPDRARDRDMAGTSFSNEVIMGTPHVGTHLDALCHVQFEGRVYGGAEAAEAEGDYGWRAMGIENVKPIVTRGVFIDVAGDRGVDRIPDGEEIFAEEIQSVVAKRGIELKSGDAVIVRTGKMGQYTDPPAFEIGQPGLSVEAAIWLYDQGMAVLGADNMAIEPQPVPNWPRNLHTEMLYHRGVHLLEWVDVEPLRQAEATTFLFVCLPLKFKGATGSWVRPIAVL
jgi:kynurenine formamidase